MPLQLHVLYTLSGWGVTLELILGPEITKIVGLAVLLVVTVHGKPPTSDGHNFFVRTPFWMFLDSM